MKLVCLCSGRAGTFHLRMPVVFRRLGYGTQRSESGGFAEKMNIKVALAHERSGMRHFPGEPILQPRL